MNTTSPIPRPSMNSTDAYLDWDYRIVSSVLWVPLTIIGVVGNLMVILVVMTVRGMKTPTNCYLVSLALSDCLFFLSTTPSELSSIHLPDNVFVFGRVGCALLRFLPYLSMNASSLSIAAFTVERYIGIVHPMKARYICTVKRAQFIIVGIWTFSVLYNSTWLFLTDLKSLPYADWPDAVQCTYSLNRESYMAIYIIDMFMFYWVPLLIYTILYGVMARTLVKAGYFDLHHHHTANEQKSRSALKQTNSFNESDHIEPMNRANKMGKARLNPGCDVRLQETSLHAQPSMMDSDNSEPEDWPASTSDVKGLDLNRLASTTVRSAVSRASDSSVNMIRNGNLKNVGQRSESVPISSYTKSPCVDRRQVAPDAGNLVTMTRTKPTSESQAYRGAKLTKSRAQVVKMLIVIVVSFALFCLPYRGLVVYNSFTATPWLDKWYLLFAKTMVMANSAVNPILYNLLSGKFRGAFVFMFKRCFSINKGPTSTMDDSRSTPRPLVSIASNENKSRQSYMSWLPKSRKSARNGIGSQNLKKSTHTNKERRTTMLVPIISFTHDHVDNPTDKDDVSNASSQ